MPGPVTYQSAILLAGRIAVTAALTLAWSLSVAAADLDRRCNVAPADREVLLARSYQEFDEAVEDFGWRALFQRGCIREAIAILDAYRDRNAGRMTNDQRLELSFHIGQILALSGYEAESLSHFEAARSEMAAEEWSAYVDATVAFIRKDRRQLLSARERYAKAAASQPMRLQIIDGLLRCFEKSYAQAVHCGLESDAR
jgi:hypothetical protein